MKNYEDLKALANKCESLEALRGALLQAVDNSNLDKYQMDDVCDTLEFLSKK